jgi:hypothetical protein
VIAKLPIQPFSPDMFPSIIDCREKIRRKHCLYRLNLSALDDPDGNFLQSLLGLASHESYEGTKLDDGNYLHPCAPKTQGVSNMNHWSAECAKCCIRKINHKAVSMFCTQCFLSRKKLLTNMRVFEHEIIDDEKHLDKCYSPFQRLYNDGYLTLVHPKYAALGLKILNTIGDVANEETTKEKGNDMAKEAEKSVLENKELARVFVEISKDTSNLQSGGQDDECPSWRCFAAM